MPKGSQFTDLARVAAANIEAAQAAGEQMTFLPDEPQAAAAGGRAPRGQGKITSQLREWCAARGLRLPEQILIEMAGMASGQDAFITAMQRAEQVLAWAEAGGVGYKGAPVQPSMAQRVQVFQFVYTAQLRAAEALLPYGLGKVTPDATPQTVVQVVMPASAPARSAPDQARDVTPQARRIGPPNAPGMLQQNQQVSATAATQSDAESRT